ncbi:MAG: hypothetical protein R3E68_00475 [Burkholderiaceae bacterium]
MIKSKVRHVLRIAKLVKDPSFSRPVPAAAWPADDDQVPEHFRLDEGAPFRMNDPNRAPMPARWQFPVHMQEARYSLVLEGGESIETARLAICPDSRLFMRLASARPQLSRPGLACSVQFVDDTTGQASPVADIVLQGERATQAWRTRAGPGLAGRSAGTAGAHLPPRPRNPSTPDWLAVADLCVTREEQLRAEIARTHRDTRIKNEIAHFKSVYHNQMYAKVQTGRARPHRASSAGAAAGRARWRGARPGRRADSGHRAAGR